MGAKKKGKKKKGPPESGWWPGMGTKGIRNKCGYYLFCSNAHNCDLGT